MKVAEAAEHAAEALIAVVRIPGWHPSPGLARALAATALKLAHEANRINLDPESMSTEEGRDALAALLDHVLWTRPWHPIGKRFAGVWGDAAEIAGEHFLKETRADKR